MNIANRPQVIRYLRSVKAPPEIRRALGDFDQFPYSETDVFSPPQGGALQAMQFAPTVPPERNRNSFALLPFSINNTDGTNGSVSILPANERRTLLLIQNQSPAANLFVNFSGDAGLNLGLLLEPGFGVFFDYICPYNAVAVYFDSASAQPGIVIEGAPQA